MFWAWLRRRKVDFGSVQKDLAFLNEIEFLKHRLETQKFRSLGKSLLCSKLLFDNTFSIESFKCSRMDIFGEFS